VVVAVTVTRTGVVPFSVAVLGDTAQLAPAGAPWQAHWTFPASPFTGTSVSA
jgi:hypothetical protein